MSGDKIFYKRGFTIPGASQFESERAEFGLESEVGEDETLAAAMHRVRVFVHGEIDLLRGRLAADARVAKDEAPRRPAPEQKPRERRWAADDEAVIDGDAMFVGRDDQWRSSGSSRRPDAISRPSGARASCAGTAARSRWQPLSVRCARRSPRWSGRTLGGRTEGL